MNKSIISPSPLSPSLNILSLYNVTLEILSLPVNIAVLDWTRWNRENLAKIHGSIPMHFRERRKAYIPPNQHK